MYTLHIGNKNYSSWSLRPWLLMRVLGIPFQERLARLDLDGAVAVRAVSPSGRVPCLYDGERLVWDSLAIVEYLAERHEAVWPRDPAARAWARSAAAEMHSGFAAFRTECPFNVGLSVRLRELTAPAVSEITRLKDLLEEGLRGFGGPFLAGQAFCAADAFYAPIAVRFRTYGIDPGGAVARYFLEILNLPEMLEWTRAGEAEPWRQDRFDDLVASRGEILQDRRAARGS